MTSGHRYRTWPLAAALALLLVVLDVAPGTATVAGPGHSHATIPERIATASLRAVSAEHHAGGRAIATIYYPELPLFGDRSDHIAFIGADADTYRTTEGGLLSPDGTRLALGGDRPGEFRMLDLRTAGERSYRVTSARDVTVTVRSLDGRSRRTVARTADGYIYDVAAGLLPGLESRVPGPPDHGPWSTWLHLAATAMLLTLASWAGVRGRRDH